MLLPLSVKPPFTGEGGKSIAAYNDFEYVA